MIPHELPGRLHRRRRKRTDHLEKLAARRDAIYQEDRIFPIRKSHENPYVQKVYKEFLGEPLSEKSHELLHTHYISRRDLIR